MTRFLRILSLVAAPLWLALALALTATTARGADPVPAFVLIGSPGIERIDAATLKRLYTGRSIEVAGTPVSVANLPPGNPLREQFLAQVIGEDNASFVAYWTVRRHIGKGTPPRELKSSTQMAEWVATTSGAIGYIAASELRPGMNVVFRP